MSTICQLYADLRYYFCMTPMDIACSSRTCKAAMTLEITRKPIDNNDTERDIRTMVMGRKAYMYCRKEESCQRAAMMYSLLGVCKVPTKTPKRGRLHPQAYRQRQTGRLALSTA